LSSLWRWFDSDYFPDGAEAEMRKPDNVDWGRCMSFVILHLGCLGVLWVGWSWPAVAAAAAFYFFRMFAVTAFYHRYFAHRTFRTSRAAQFAFAVLGGLSVQRGALWWAAVHRKHHQHADHEEDVHSPGLSGFWWAHIGWMTSARNFPTNYKRIKDLARFPELVFLNRFDLLIPFCFAIFTYGFGFVLGRVFPASGTSGLQMLVWVFFISTVVLLHATLCINSLAHTFGRRRYATDDDSRNNFLLALVTLGEGWHNNHHHCMTAARQGFYWWEIDVTYYLLKALSWTGLIWDLHAVPKTAYETAARRGANPAKA
jgi:stearoyl-CoA desaturase (delta-9 desaturase)